MVEICSRSDPHLSDCLIRNIEKQRPKFNKGIPDLFVPPMNPLIIPEVSFNSGTSFNSTFKRMQLYGLENMKVEHLEVELKTPSVKTTVIIPFLRTISDYHIKGRLLVPLDGHGSSYINYSKYNYGLSLKIYWR